MKFLRRYYLTFIVVAAILVLSLAHISPDNDLPDIPYLDKAAHCLMYLGLVATFCFDLYRATPARTSYRKPLWTGWLLAVLLGGAMEAAQLCLTTYRSGDWGDMAANLLGATLGIVAGVFVSKPLSARIGRYF